MNRNNFIGLSGFVWWVGVVEDVKDPLASGRARIRIFGWHTMTLLGGAGAILLLLLFIFKEETMTKRF